MSSDHCSNLIGSSASVAVREYEPPAIIALGTLAELTQGDGSAHKNWDASLKTCAGTTGGSQDHPSCV